MDQVHKDVIAWVFQKTIANLSPIQQLIESLLWRGVMAESKGDLILLHKGSRVGDKSEDETLKQLGICLSEIDSPEYRAAIDCRQVSWQYQKSDANSWAFEVFGDTPTVSQAILAFPSPCGITGVGRIYGDWKNFSRRKRGYSLSAFELDLGVSLLVRILNSYGVSTRISGQGGNMIGFRLYIEFDGEYAFAIGQSLFEYLKNTGLVAVNQNWNKCEDVYECRWPIVQGLKALVEAQNQARSLLDIKFANKVLKCKSLALKTACEEKNNPSPALVTKYFGENLAKYAAKPNPTVKLTKIFDSSL